jgi:hypothetical protein
MNQSTRRPKAGCLLEVTEFSNNAARRADSRATSVDVHILSTSAVTVCKHASTVDSDN